MSVQTIMISVQENHKFLYTSKYTEKHGEINPYCWESPPGNLSRAQDLKEAFAARVRYNYAKTRNLKPKAKRSESKRNAFGAQPWRPRLNRRLFITQEESSVSTNTRIDDEVERFIAALEKFKVEDVTKPTSETTGSPTTEHFTNICPASRLDRKRKCLRTVPLVGEPSCKYAKMDHTCTRRANIPKNYGIKGLNTWNPADLPTSSTKLQ